MEKRVGPDGLLQVRLTEQEEDRAREISSAMVAVLAEFVDAYLDDEVELVDLTCTGAINMLRYIETGQRPR